MPSPALSTPASIHPLDARRDAAPLAGCLMTTPSAPIACERLRSVLERLALGHRAPFGAEVDDVGREPLGGGLERDPSARRILEEEVHDGLAAQRRELLHLALLRCGHVLGGVEDAGSRRRGSVCACRAGASCGLPSRRRTSCTARVSTARVSTARVSTSTSSPSPRRRAQRASPRSARARQLGRFLPM